MDDPNCVLKKIQVLDDLTGQPIEEEAYVCNNQPDMDETVEEVDLSNAPEKAPLDATVRHPDEVEEVEEEEEKEES